MAYSFGKAEQIFFYKYRTLPKIVRLKPLFQGHGVDSTCTSSQIEAIDGTCLECTDVFNAENQGGSLKKGSLLLTSGNIMTMCLDLSVSQVVYYYSRLNSKFLLMRCECQTDHWDETLCLRYQLCHNLRLL